MHPGTPITGVTGGTFHDPDRGARLQRQHPLPHHAHGHRLERAAVPDLGHRLPAEGQPHLRHDAAGGHALPRRHRAHRTVRLRHAGRLQAHDRGAQPDHRRQHLHLRVLVGRRGAAAHGHGSVHRAVVYGQLCRDRQLEPFRSCTARAYSLDLRERVVAGCGRQILPCGGGTVRRQRCQRGSSGPPMTGAAQMSCSTVPRACSGAANRITPGLEPGGSIPGLGVGCGPSTGTCLRRSTGYLPPSALQSGVVRDGRPIARKASAVMPSVWVTLSTRPTILFDSEPSAFALTSVTNTEPEA